MNIISLQPHEKYDRIDRKEVITLFCPHCNNLCEAHDRFCSHCGAPLVSTGPQKGRHWVPVLIMVILCAFGTGLFFAFPSRVLPAPAVNEAVTENSWFYVDNGVLYFEESRYSGGSELTIPDKLFGQTIIGIGESCFENCAELTAINLPASLQTIGNNAFRGCTSLRGIKIPESVQSIGSGAFADCSALEAISINSTVRIIETGVFSGCNKLMYIYYDGIYEDWTKLYPEFINPYATVFCKDGSFFQGGIPY